MSVVATPTGDDETGPVVHLVAVAAQPNPPAGPTAEQRMWAYYVAERSEVRTPTGSEMDRVDGTNNYGRKVLRRWRREGRTVDGDKAGQRRPD